MNWETIIVACVAGLGPAIVGLFPLWLKMRDDRRKEKSEALKKSNEVALAEKKLHAEIESEARRASETLIRELTARVDVLESDRDELEAKLDAERAKRRDAEDRLEEAKKQIATLERKVEKLEKRDTGELKAKT